MFFGVFSKNILKFKSSSYNSQIIKRKSKFLGWDGNHGTLINAVTVSGQGQALVLSTAGWFTNRLGGKVWVTKSFCWVLPSPNKLGGTKSKPFLTIIDLPKMFAVHDFDICWNVGKGQLFFFKKKVVWSYTRLLSKKKAVWSYSRFLT